MFLLNKIFVLGVRVNLSNLFQKAWAEMGCEHTYVHIGESLPRYHEKTFAILLNSELNIRVALVLKIYRIIHIKNVN